MDKIIKQQCQSSAETETVQLISTHQHAQGLQPVLSPGLAQEKQLLLTWTCMQEVQVIGSMQHAQGLQLAQSQPGQEKQAFQSSTYTQEKQAFQSSTYTEEVQLKSSPQHSQAPQLVQSTRHLPEEKQFQPSAFMQEVQLIPSPQHAQGLVMSPRRWEENEVLLSPKHAQEIKLIPSIQHAQGLQFVQSLQHAQAKPFFQPSEQMQEVELIPSPDQRAHLQENQLVETTPHLQETLPLYTPSTHVKEITEYLIAHELWQVPDSVLYEEPVAETRCDLETCLDDINDATDGTEEYQDINTLNVEDCAEVKARRRGGRRHKGHFMKRPMALSEVIDELKNNNLRENALRCLSGHLVERRVQDPDFYRQAGFYIFHSCSTLTILIQEILFVYGDFYKDDLNVRRSKRMANVLCLLQCVAANDETRLHFVKAQIPNYLIPFILSEYTEEVYENLRALSLSVISILCQTLQKDVIQWALQTDIIEVCFYALDVGSELSKVLAMTVLDSILRVDEGLAAICDPSCDLLPRFIKLCEDLVSVLAYIRGFSPRLLFLVVRSFILLCQNCRALEVLKDQMPTQLQDTTFRDVKMEYPLFAYLRHLLLLCTGKASDYLPSVDSSPATPASSSSVRNNWGDKSSPGIEQTRKEIVRVYVTPMHPVNLNKQDWCSSHRLQLQT